MSHGIHVFLTYQRSKETEICGTLTRWVHTTEPEPEKKDCIIFYTSKYGKSDVNLSVQQIK
jgi:hypothetical protein